MAVKRFAFIVHETIKEALYGSTLRGNVKWGGHECLVNLKCCPCDSLLWSTSQ